MRFIIIIFFFVHILVNANSDVDEIQKIVASDRSANDYFGWAVSISGDYAIVGAPYEDHDASGGNQLAEAGSAYIYVRNGDTWTLLQKIVASDRQTNSFFGFDVSISGDYAIVSAHSETKDENGINILSNAGSAYIFVRNGNTWSEQQKLVPSDRAAGDYFGWSVSINGDYAIVGSPFEDHDASGGNALADAGSAYIFVRNGSTWSEQQKIVASDRAVNDQFGISVSIHGDYAIVGAYVEDHDESGGNTLNESGSAYIYVRSGVTWTQQQKIVASDRGVGDRFGNFVAIEGEYAIVGAYLEDHDENGVNFLSDAGSAYIFVRNGSSWTQQQKIVASDRGAGDSFGAYVAIRNNYALVGAHLEDHDASGGNLLSNSGSAYLFKRVSNSWSEQQKIVASDREANATFGFVSISDYDIIIGARQEVKDENGANSLSNAGAAYIYKIIEPPIISTSNVTSISTVFAVSGGNISDGGSNPILQRGIVWDVNPNPTISLNTKTQNGPGTNSFSANLTGLTKNTLYYVRAYITTSFGTYYGNEVSFTTLPFEIDEDGNQDGILDELQDNVFTILDGYKQTYISIVSPIGTTINSVATGLNEDNNFVYPFGQLEFKINAAQATIKIYFHGSSDLSQYTYRKLLPNNTYGQFDNVTFSTEIINGNQVAVATLNLVDGGAGDYDGIVNGVIYDPGGPALPVSANIPFWDWWYALLLIPIMVYSYKRFS